MIELSRRGLIGILAAGVGAAIVRPGVLMPVKPKLVVPTVTSGLIGPRTVVLPSAFVDAMQIFNNTSEDIVMTVKLNDQYVSAFPVGNGLNLTMFMPIAVPAGSFLKIEPMTPISDGTVEVMTAMFDGVSSALSRNTIT